MEALFRIGKFIGYQRHAQTKYYLHSPFVYQFYLNVLEGTTDNNLASINALRKQLRSGSETITTTDHGTGTSRTVTISKLERTVALPAKYGEVLYRMASYFKPAHMLELGTSIGISSAYLALGSPRAHVTSIDADKEVINVAQRNYAALGIKNVQTINGNFEEILSVQIESMPTLDLVYFDGNHRKDATLKYFTTCLQKVNDNTIFVFDDIYWSKEMGEAWEKIKQHPRVKLTIDVYRFGICFFSRDRMAKEHFVLRY